MKMKVFFHDFSLTISLIDFTFGAFCFVESARKGRLSTSMLTFLVMAKKHTNLVQFRSKIGDVLRCTRMCTTFP